MVPCCERFAFNTSHSHLVICTYLSSWPRGITVLTPAIFAPAYVESLVARSRYVRLAISLSVAVSSYFCVILLQLPTSFICRNKDDVWFLCCDFIQLSKMCVIQRHFIKILSRPFHCLGHFMVECVLSSHFFDQVERAANVRAAKVRISGSFNEIYGHLSVVFG